MAPGPSPTSGIQNGCGVSSPMAGSARTRDTSKIAKNDAKNVEKPSINKLVSPTPVIVRRTDTRVAVTQQGRDPPTRSTVGKTVAVKPSAKLPATGSTAGKSSLPPKAPEPSVHSNGLWFEDGRPGKEYTALYSLLDQEPFHGYPCLEGKLVGEKFNVPEESIKKINDQLAQNPASAPFVDGFEHGKPNSLPYVGTPASFQQYNKNLKVGIAIQRIYMSILRRENARQGITSFARGPGPTPGWTLYIGDLVDSMNIPLLEKRGIGFVVSIHPEDFRCKGQNERLAKAGIKHHSCRLDDSKGADMLSKLGGLIHMMNEHTSSPKTDPKRRSVLVHCMAGLSRSVNVALGWAQREYYEKEIKDLPSTISAKQRYDMVNRERTRVFEELKSKRPGVKCDNFQAQLERHAAQMVGYHLPAPAVPVAALPVKASEEHGGGGYLKEAVVWFYYIYHLRPSLTVIKFGYERIAKAKGSTNSLQMHLKPWCDKCYAKVQAAGAASQKGNM